MDPKSKKTLQNPTKPDNLSSLPDSILTHILSFLDTRSAISSSLIAKRYKLLWTFLPSLNFKLSDSHSHSPEQHSESHIFPKKSYPLTSPTVPLFENYVNTVLSLREHTNLTSFRISLHKQVSLEFLQHCVEYAADHKVQHLRIRGYCKNGPLLLPESLIVSSNLISLHLHNATSFNIELPQGVRLVNLKSLSLKKFEFSSGSFNGEVFSGCPGLESLVLSKCWIRADGAVVKTIGIRCLELRCLVIKYWRSPWRCFNEQMICVWAPKLEEFRFRGHVARIGFGDGGLPCLERGVIDLCYPSGCATVVDVNERNLKTKEGFFSMIRQFGSVKMLSLSLRTIEVLSTICDFEVCAPCNFENLRLIKLTTEDNAGEEIIPIAKIVGLLERVASDVVMFDVDKEPKDTPGCSKTEKDTTSLHLPANVMHFLVESSPAAEFLSIEIPKVSSDEE